jgi:hypothetical protein
MTFLTKAAFARKHKVRPATITKWVAAGRAVLAPDGRRIAVEASEALLAQRPRWRSGGVAKGPVAADDGEVAISIAEAQRKLLAAKAAREEFELAKARGNFLAGDEVIRQIAPILVGIRQAVLHIPGAAAFEIPSLTKTDRQSLVRLCEHTLEDARLARAYLSLATAEDASNLEAEFNQIRPHLLELPLQLADRLVGLTRGQIRQILHEAICDALEKLSSKTEKLQ